MSLTLYLRPLSEAVTSDAAAVPGLEIPWPSAFPSLFEAKCFVLVHLENVDFQYRPPAHVNRGSHRTWVAWEVAEQARQLGKFVLSPRPVPPAPQSHPVVPCIPAPAPTPLLVDLSDVVEVAPTTSSDCRCGPPCAHCLAAWDRDAPQSHGVSEEMEARAAAEETEEWEGAEPVDPFRDLVALAKLHLNL